VSPRAPPKRDGAGQVQLALSFATAPLTHQQGMIARRRWNPVTHHDECDFDVCPKVRSLVTSLARFSGDDVARQMLERTGDGCLVAREITQQLRGRLTLGREPQCVLVQLLRG
jgi:hypothetical protein